MTSSKQTAALAVAGAVALASAAYALGTQTGDGSAAAAGAKQAAPPAAPGRPGFFRERRPDLSALATRLGVSTSALRQALDELRPTHRREIRDDLAKKLADALGIDVAKVAAALDKLRATRHERHGLHDLAAALAKQLGVTQAKLRAAFETLRADREKAFQQRRDAFAEQLAGKLGLDVAKVKAALADFGPWGCHP
jgi:DNA-binding MarR family transcriptional regulator